MSHTSQIIKSLEATLDTLRADARMHRRRAVTDTMLSFAALAFGLVLLLGNYIEMGTINGIGLFGAVLIVMSIISAGFSKNHTIQAFAATQEYLLVNERYQELLDNQ